MRLMAYQRYRYTARLFDYEIANDANGTMVYTEVGDVDIDFATDPNAPRVVIFCAVPLRKGVQLKAIRNPRGVYVMGESTYTVTGVEPIISVLGDLEGYRMQAALSTEAF